LSTDNSASFTGTISVAQGVLQIGSPTALGAPSSVVTVLGRVDVAG
jgi:autotransporter-associated beta strand protein